MHPNTKIMLTTGSVRKITLRF